MNALYSFRRDAVSEWFQGTCGGRRLEDRRGRRVTRLPKESNSQEQERLSEAKRDLYMLDEPHQRRTKAYYDAAHLSECRLDDTCEEDCYEEPYCSESPKVWRIRHV